MHDRREERTHQDGHWAGIAVLAAYAVGAWVGIELLSPVLGQELALGIFAAIGVFVAVGAIKVAEHVAARRQRARPQA